MPALKARQGIEEVIFVDDFFRSQENELSPESRVNRKFVRAFFGTSIARLGWRVREIEPRSQGGTFPVSEIMKALGLPPNRDGWAAACTADLNQAAEHLDEFALTPASLVIGWGMPPSVLKYIDQQGAAFLDVELHAIRFARDLHMAMRTNDAGIQRELMRLRIDDEVFWAGAAGLHGYFARRGISSIVRPDVSVGLFVGQTDVDLALVHDGRLTKPSDFLPQLQQWAQEVDMLAICPHPGQVDISALYALLDQIPQAVIIGRNTYGLLCADNLKFVTGISSSVLKEAAYLGHRDIRPLIQDDRNTASALPPTCSAWIPVRLEVVSLRSLQAFSRARQGGWQWPALRRSAERPSAFPEDMLNSLFGYRWGLDPSAYGLPTLPKLAPSNSLSPIVDTPGGLSTTFGRGWLWPEAWGVWSGERRACLILPLDCPDPAAPGGYDLDLHGHPYVLAGAPPLDIRVRVNGRECELRASHENGMQWGIHLDADAVRSGLLLIVFSVPGAVRQCDVGGNATDLRAIGIGLRQITLRESDGGQVGQDAG